MRELLCTRKQLTRERSRHVQRLQKTLEDVTSSSTRRSPTSGLSGRKMIDALIAGESDPEQLAHLAHRRIKALPEALREALRGRVTRPHASSRAFICNRSTPSHTGGRPLFPCPQSRHLHPGGRRVCRPV
jgi:hypothetical protein